MNMNRLKFAWARGARLQRWLVTGFGHGNGEWTTLDTVPSNPYATLRIHPDDAHLEYGPLSQVCINIALDQNGELHETPLLAAADAFVQGVKLNDNRSFAVDFDQIEWDMAYLFFAEYLADQGL